MKWELRLLKNSFGRTQIRKSLRRLCWRHLTSLSAATRVNTRVVMARRCLPGLITVLRSMGPCHACDYVDVFMGELGRELASRCPVPLLSSIVPPQCREELVYLDWSRLRDDGITILPDSVSLSRPLNNIFRAYTHQT